MDTSRLSSPGLTGRSSNHGPGVLDCQSKSDASDFDHLVSAEVGQARLRVKPGNDTDRVDLIGKRSKYRTISDREEPKNAFDRLRPRGICRRRPRGRTKLA